MFTPQDGTDLPEDDPERVVELQVRRTSPLVLGLDARLETRTAIGVSDNGI